MILSFIVLIYFTIIYQYRHSIKYLLIEAQWQDHLTLRMKSSRETNSSSMRLSIYPLGISVLHSLRSIMYCISRRAHSLTSSSLSL